MKVFLALTCLLAAPAFAQEDPAPYTDNLPEFRVVGEPATPEDAEAVGAVARALGETWGAGDAAGVAALYADDAEWTNAFGNVLRGPDEMRAFLSEMFGGEDNTLAAEDEQNYRPISLRYVGDDVAILHGVTWATRSGTRSGLGIRQVHNTVVFAKEDGEWQIIHHVIGDARE